MKGISRAAGIRSAGWRTRARRASRGLPAAMVCLLVAGCEHINPQYNHFTSRLPQATQLSSVTVTNQIDPAWLQPSTELFTLGPGDKLEIEMLGEPGTRTTTTVGPDGKIYFNLLPGIDVWGLTLGQAKAEMEK